MYYIIRVQSNTCTFFILNRRQVLDTPAVCLRSAAICRQFNHHQLQLYLWHTWCHTYCPYCPVAVCSVHLRAGWTRALLLFQPSGGKMPAAGKCLHECMEHSNTHTSVLHLSADGCISGSQYSWWPHVNSRKHTVHTHTQSLHSACVPGSEYSTSNLQN